MSETIELPKVKVKASQTDPRSLVIFANYKIGKTTLLKDIDNALIFDLEGGTDFIDCMKVKINKYEDVALYGEEIKKQGNPYKFIVVDTITALEEMSLALALKMYKEQPIGKNYKEDSVLKLPQGAGYYWAREAFFKLLNYIKTLAPNVILIAHNADRTVEKEGKEFIAKELSLTGKLRSMVAANCDAIGYMYRKGNQNILNFKANDEVICGARSPHLKDQEIVISEKMDDGSIKTYWNKIFIKN